MGKLELVSVIVTTYKRANLISRAILSVLSQSYKHYEVLIVDDNPVGCIEKKETQAVVRKFLGQANIRYIDLQGNFGYALARNVGIRESKGKYIAFLDDDDEWLPHKLTEQVKCIQEDSSIGMVYCRSVNLKENGEIYKSNKKKLPSGYIFEKILAQDIIGATSKVLVRKSCIDLIGSLNELTPTRADHDFFLRISKKYKIGLVDEVLVNFYIEGNRLSRDFEKKLAGWKFFFASWEEELKKYPKAMKSQKFKFNYEIGKILFLKGETKKSKQFFKKAIALKPYMLKAYFLLFCSYLNISSNKIGLK
ncbi:glycosyltransferase family 2 protein [Nodosilinea sp. P-1105]|uniref:glycosyltransferase family 2 protein n=1 Tax=Nodosilinea sp. P-1105 TaxID=2546229 RepID=UPI00146B5A3B|nr:glycosyltransferase family 2 protein [Nodosilinea sp. P-1105]NMF82637.1 glycosyltransferase family 2 protein [Nodosilinea sp. P-1105]